MTSRTVPNRPTSFATWRGAAGVTLVEILTAAFVIVVAFVVIMKLISLGSTQTVKSGSVSKATRLLQELVEECKHVPMAEYEKTYKEFPDGTETEIAEKFFPRTLKSIEEFRDVNRESLKDFVCSTTLRLQKNDLNQIKEIWFGAEIRWKDLGSVRDGANEHPERIIRAGNALYNPAAH